MKLYKVHATLSICAFADDALSAEQLFQTLLKSNDITPEDLVPKWTHATVVECVDDLPNGCDMMQRPYSATPVDVTIQEYLHDLNDHGGDKG